jgi:peptide/nickel transport system permease protein
VLPARAAGAGLLTLAALAAALAPLLAPNPPDRRHPDLLFAPPTRVRALDEHGVAPHLHALRLVSRIERRFEEDRTRPVPLRWLSGGRLVTAVGDGATPLLLLGADGFGRDVFARLLYGSRITLALAAAATLGAVALGAAVGGVAGYAGGLMDDALSRGLELLLVLPAMYVALAVRAALPLVLPAGTVFLILTVIFAVLGLPIVARGVRAIVASERSRDYVQSARAIGASPPRILFRHLLPASRGYIAVQAVLLLPSFILAEATLTYVGLGFPDVTPTWGTLLRDASQAALLGGSPWVLAPALAIFLVVLGVNLLVGVRRRLLAA